MQKKVYVAVVRRVIRDEIELQLVVNGDMDQLEIEKRAQDMAAKLSQFEPSALTTSVKADLVVLDLVAADPAKDQLKMKL